MTTLAAAPGALPLAVGWVAGSELRQPLGIAIIVCLIVSELLTLRAPGLDDWDAESPRYGRTHLEPARPRRQVEG